MPSIWDRMKIMVRLDGEEQELVESFERDEWRPVPERVAAIERYRDYARTTFKKDMRVNIRISSKDLEALQIRALEEGIPYQTHIASVLHLCNGSSGGRSRCWQGAEHSSRPLIRFVRDSGHIGSPQHG